jgi:serine/threonine protein phosphatase PrpC
MEDSHIAALHLEGGVSFFGVFDGHGGILRYTLTN